MIELRKIIAKDIVIFGSGSIVLKFANHGLIDDYCLITNPEVLENSKTPI